MKRHLSWNHTEIIWYTVILDCFLSHFHCLSKTQRPSNFPQSLDLLHGARSRQYSVITTVIRKMLKCILEYCRTVRHTVRDFSLHHARSNDFSSKCKMQVRIVLACVARNILFLLDLSPIAFIRICRPYNIRLRRLSLASHSMHMCRFESCRTLRNEFVDFYLFHAKWIESFRKYM